jgi:hypothetical protein
MIDPRNRQGVISCSLMSFKMPDYNNYSADNFKPFFTAYQIPFFAYDAYRWFDVSLHTF